VAKNVRVCRIFETDQTNNLDVANEHRSITSSARAMRVEAAQDRAPFGRQAYPAAIDAAM
jgi:DNA-binding transcriptional regulator WhiA